MNFGTKMMMMMMMMMMMVMMIHIPTHYVWNSVCQKLMNHQ